jgi:23S rRNA (uracil1939-C5)-methyltransferase
VGFFSLELADLVEGYLGLELDPQAVKAARRNADRRGRTRGEFRLGATEELLPGVVKALSPAQTTVILDPPRAGCLRPAIDALRVARPAQVIYVSCHPATLARDVGLLCGEGAFTVREVVPLDLFPQTQHVECVADLRATP